MMPRVIFAGTILLAVGALFAMPSAARAEAPPAAPAASTPAEPRPAGQPDNVPAHMDLGAEKIRFEVQPEDDLRPGALVAGRYTGSDLTLQVLYRLTLRDSRGPSAETQLVGRLAACPLYCTTYEPVEYARQGSKFLASYRRGKPNLSHGEVPASVYFAADLPPDLPPGTYGLEMRCLNEAETIPPLIQPFVVPPEGSRQATAALEPVILTEKDNGRTVRASVGQEIHVLLKDEIGYWKQDGRFGGGGSHGAILKSLDPPHPYLPEIEPGQVRKGPGTFVEEYLAQSPGRADLQIRRWIWQRMSGAPDSIQDFRATVEVAEDFASRFVSPTVEGSQGWGAAVNGVRMRLVPERTRYAAGEPISASLEFECLKGYPDGFTFCILRRGVGLRVGAEGLSLDFPPNEPLFIQEHTVYRRPLFLAEVAAMQTPDTYVIKADHSLDSPYLPDEWTGKIEATPVTIEVVPAAPAPGPAVASPAPDAQAGWPPLSEVSLATAMQRTRAIALCEATSGPIMKIDDDGRPECYQQVKVLRVFLGVVPQAHETVQYRFDRARGQRPVKYAEKALWMLDTSEPRWIALKALEDTAANHEIVRQLAAAHPIPANDAEEERK